MVGSRVVVQRDLDKLKSGKTDGIESQVICAARVADGESVHTEIVERDHPGGKNRSDHFISLEINAANFAGAVVDVVVGVELGVLWSRLHHFRIGEVLLDVGTRTQQALLFAGPEADTDGAAHLQAGGF